MIPFYKMTALGNDYIFVNDLQNQGLLEKIRPYISHYSDRNFGIGGDGVIFIEPSTHADCRMRIFNSDASEAKMCGNGIRQLAKLVWDQNWIKKNPLTVETGAGIMIISMEIKNDIMTDATVDMGKLQLDTSSFCTAVEKHNNTTIFTRTFQDKEYTFYAGTVGSNNCVTILKEDVNHFDFCTFGKMIEKDSSLLPDGANIIFINIKNPYYAIMRVWERGSGHTLACGTGATCAAALLAHLGHLDPSQEIQIELERGSLYITHNAEGHIFMRGEAQFCFQGGLRPFPPS